MKKQNSTVVNTTSSPFKVTVLDSTQVETRGSGIKIPLGNIHTNIKQNNMLLLCHYNT